MITLTPIAWTVRTGPAHEGYGDPYEGVATVQRWGRGACERGLWGVRYC